MDSPDLGTASGRIAFAIEQSGKTLERIADEIGCSHAAISQWQRGRTDPESIKAGLLLTGKGPRVSRYLLTSELERLATALRAMESRSPQQVETVVRMVEAAATER